MEDTKVDICKACEHEKSGGFLRVHIPHTCGNSNARAEFLKKVVEYRQSKKQAHFNPPKN